MWKVKRKSDGIDTWQVAEEEKHRQLKELIGHSVVNVIRFWRGHFDLGFIITFDNGLRLTAQNRVYGDNTFRFLEEGEYEDVESQAG